MAQLVKNLPAMQEICIRSLGWEDLLEKELANHSSVLAWIVGASGVGQWLRIHLPMQETQETQVGFLGQEDSLKEERATHSSILV